ncbi:ABC transporter ATP-binding protein [Limimaricola litoreus]|uniref:ABC transporter ATP-binding protein/permease n=1 Tax=Limimaricola litoreus TaxID=2955316 RepID=A0A9X2FTX9_9RHOB|nr:ABC transporter ATP-binding protein [Limimaricola litoreus]MCP1168396.1 ABC transporter ATP-binding protein/permease [Limimaricola litoreus]
MNNPYKKLFQLLDRRERFQFGALALMSVISGLLEAAGAAAILPFLQVIANPELLRENDIFAFLYRLGGFATDLSFLVALGSVLLAVALLNIGFKALTTYAVSRFSVMRAFSISTTMMRGYLFQPYSWFLYRNSSNISKVVLGEVDGMVRNSMLPAMSLLATVATVTSITVLLFVMEPGVAIGAVILLGGSYMITYTITRRKLLTIGQRRFQANSQRFRIAQEATGGIKDIKILGLEDTVDRRFRRQAYRMANMQARGLVIQQMPRYGLEAFAYGGMILLILALLIRSEGDIRDMLPTLGLVAVAGSRLFPALQSLFSTFSSLRMGQSTLDNVINDLAEIRRHQGSSKPTAISNDVTPLGLRDALTIRNVSFRFEQAEQDTLHDISMTIPANSVIGLVGGTGAGKSTLVDLILGLLDANRGQVLADGVPITNENRRSWQRSIGYVPQQIFLADDTVAANIAFGQDATELDMEAVIRAAQVAELHDFVTKELPDGYETRVGERGIRLSGGQRQRIGIARALYHNPDILILDEATSALDNLTEAAVMEAVHNLGGKKTIILIAHRLTTVESCDTIYLLEKGRMKASGNYVDLVHKSFDFRRMAGIQ